MLERENQLSSTDGLGGTYPFPAVCSGISGILSGSFPFQNPSLTSRYLGLPLPNMFLFSYFSWVCQSSIFFDRHPLCFRLSKATQTKPPAPWLHILKVLKRRQEPSPQLFSTGDCSHTLGTLGKDQADLKLKLLHRTT